MSKRTPVTIVRLIGDQALIQTASGDTERYLAADISVALGTSYDRLNGLQLTARRNARGRLYDWGPGDGGQPMTQPASRVRLYGGRHTHTAQPGRGTTYRTPCGHITTRNDHWLPDDTPVTCPACKRALARTASR